MNLPKAEVWTLLKDDRFWLPNQEGCGAKVVLTRRVVVRFAFNRGTGEVAAPPVSVHTSIWDLFSCYRISQQNRGANVVQMPHSLAGPADIYRTIV